MKWKMAENSLFAVLLRSSWWISAAIGIGLAGLAYALLPADFRIAGMFSALPFAAIAAWAGYQQLRAPSAGRIERTLGALRDMPWSALAPALESAWQREGFAVKRAGGAADFELAKQGRVTLVAAKRWKAAHTGVAPLRELVAAKEAREANEAAWLSIGELTAEARDYAVRERVRVVGIAELARLLPEAGRR